MRRWRVAVFLSGILLAGCGGVNIAPKPQLPRALVDKIPAKVGLLLGSEQRALKHLETRGGIDWNVELGEGHQALSREVFTGLFAEVVELSELELAGQGLSVQGIFEPKIELFSFATARETGGEYVAVTIRYTINVLTPEGEIYDRLTLTGYGSSAAGGMSAGEPIDTAARAAMRDAAAKILTQLPALPLAQELTGGTRLQVDAAAMAAKNKEIEAVPVRPSRRVNPLWRPGSGS